MFEKGSFPAKYFDVILTFDHTPFYYFVQKVNAIWYPGRTIIKLCMYRFPLTSCTKWWNDKTLNVIVWSKLVRRKVSLIRFTNFTFAKITQCIVCNFVYICMYNIYNLTVSEKMMKQFSMRCFHLKTCYLPIFTGSQWNLIRSLT